MSAKAGLVIVVILFIIGLFAVVIRAARSAADSIFTAAVVGKWTPSGPNKAASDILEIRPDHTYTYKGGNHSWHRERGDIILDEMKGTGPTTLHIVGEKLGETGTNGLQFDHVKEKP